VDDGEQAFAVQPLPSDDVLEIGARRHRRFLEADAVAAFHAQKQRFPDRKQLLLAADTDRGIKRDRDARVALGPGDAKLVSADFEAVAVVERQRLPGFHHPAAELGAVGAFVDDAKLVAVQFDRGMDPRNRLVVGLVSDADAVAGTAPDLEWQFMAAVRALTVLDHLDVDEIVHAGRFSLACGPLTPARQVYSVALLNSGLSIEEE